MSLQNTTKHYIFDLDDTLVQYNPKPKVPRETWHVLRKLHEQGSKLYIISYNPLAPLIAAELQLTQYIEDIFTSRPPRDQLITKLLVKYPEITEFTYFDDSKDNIKEITDEFRPKYRIHTFHVITPIKCKLLKL
ncbi:haloacid dehalogenase-like hydrolase motif-containing [Pacmanvirus S19]|nr:haloacid dehalogenase-like hydrolase motif-containing [Pacmanvirus S19]